VLQAGRRWLLAGGISLGARHKRGDTGFHERTGFLLCGEGVGREDTVEKTDSWRFTGAYAFACKKVSLTKRGSRHGKKGEGRLFASKRDKRFEEFNG